MKLSFVASEMQDTDDLAQEQFALDVLVGLSGPSKNISAKYFYDDKGSEIFQKISQHHDYYLTRTEYQILNEKKSTLPDLIVDQEIDVIELGAGDGHKSNLVLRAFLDVGRKMNFYPIDISERAMHLLVTNVDIHRNLNVHGIVGEYFEGLRLVRKMSGRPKLVLFLGSNIGNFNRSQSQGFLRKLWKNLGSNDFVLIGFDLKKDISVLTRAYNDDSGLTRDFNLNILARINRELGGNFDLDKFDHFGSYNPLVGAMESYLVSKVQQEIYISELQRSFQFNEFEPIHLEYSFKFLKAEIDFLCTHSGYSVAAHFSDSKQSFIDSLWKVEKTSPVR